VNTKAKSTPRDTIEPKSKSPKKWKFPWSFSEPDDDLLFGDVSERNNAEIEASMGKPKS
jgi:hypothetical protein